MSHLPYAEALLTQGYCLFPSTNWQRLKILIALCHGSLKLFTKMPLEDRMKFCFCFDRRPGAQLGDLIEGEQSDDGYLRRNPEENPLDDDKDTWHHRRDLDAQLRAIGAPKFMEVASLLQHGEELRALMRQNFLIVLDQIDRHPLLSNYGLGDLFTEDNAYSPLRFIRYNGASNRQGDNGVVGGFHQDRAHFTQHVKSRKGCVQACNGDPRDEASWGDVVRKPNELLLFGGKKLALLTGAETEMVEVPGGVIKLCKGGVIPALTHRGRTDSPQDLSAKPRKTTVVFYQGDPTII